MRVNWEKTFIVTLDVALAVYLVLVFTSFNKPDEGSMLCTKVNINIQDEATNGFIDRAEIESRLKKLGLYPISKPLSSISTRSIEEALMTSSFVKTAECFKTQNGHVNISITQRMPIVRIKSDNGDDYYLDDNNSIMPNSHYTSDLIVATGSISRLYAINYISPLSKVIMGNEMWKNLVEQINVLPDLGVEIVPRVGNHIVYLGQLPEHKVATVRYKLISDFMSLKMSRLEKFYKYGLSVAGWNKYSYINIEFDNQIICKRRGSSSPVTNFEQTQPEETTSASENNTTDNSQTSDEHHDNNPSQQSSTE